MRLPRTALALILAVTLGACGDDEPEPIPTPARTVPAQRPAPPQDTMRTDTMATGAGAESPGQTGQRTGGAAGAGASEGEPEDVASPTGTGQRDAAPVPSARLYTVQVAAFTSPESARTWTGRLGGLNLPVWTSVAELGGTTYYRVRVGAVPTVSEARRLGSLLSDRLEWPVWVAPITPADRLPANAVATTRQVLQGD